MNAAYFHLVLNHLPINGVFFGVVIVLAGRIFKSETTQRVGLWMLVAAAVFAIPVYISGEPAEEIVEMLPGVSGPFIEHHQESAAFALAGALAVGLLGAVMLFLMRGAKPIASAWWLAVILLGVVTSGFLVRTAFLGGKIRHTEIR
ncbi:DUF2231 domain-containing protein [Verrucomicrobiota bacterium sgz303538]